MKKIAIIAMFILASCSSNNNSTDNPDHSASDFIVDISKLSSENFDLNEISTQIAGSLNLGVAVSSETTKVLLVKNSSTSTQGLDISVSGEGYSLKLNRCPSSLAGGESCQITISFKSSRLYDGVYPGIISITDNPDDLVLNLSAEIQGKPNILVEGEHTLVLSMSSPFVHEDNELKKQLLRDVVVTNIGPYTSSPITVNLSSDYVIRLNRCPSRLKPGYSCTLQVLWKNFRNAQPSPSSESFIEAISIDNQVGLILATGLAKSYSPVVPLNPTRITTIGPCNLATKYGDMGTAGHFCENTQFETIQVTGLVDPSLIDGKTESVLYEGTCSHASSNAIGKYTMDDPHFSTTPSDSFNIGITKHWQYSELAYSFLIYERGDDLCETGCEGSGSGQIKSIKACLDIGTIRLADPE